MSEEQWKAWQIEAERMRGDRGSDSVRFVTLVDEVRRLQEERDSILSDYLHMRADIVEESGPRGGCGEDLK